MYTDPRTAQLMIIGIQLAGTHGAHPGAWRMPQADPNGYADIDTAVRHAQVADRGGLQFIFVPDRPLLDADLSQGPPRFQMEPMLLLTAIARATERIGLVPSMSTSLTEPYTLARQLKALDVISHGRAGWNAIATNDPAAFANYGKSMPPRLEKYERLHETIPIVQALWGSWEYEAGAPDKNGRFADPAHVRPVELQGQHVGARGPLPIPPSEQGQPVIVQAGGGGLGLQAAAMYADVIVGMATSIEDGQAYRKAIHQAVTQAGRDPKTVKLVMFVTFSLGDTVREALDRRRELDARVDERPRMAELGALLGTRIDPSRFDAPLPAGLLDADSSPSPDPRAARARRLAREGWSPRDVIAHGALDHTPGLAGTPADAADFLQRYVDAGAADGFILSLDAHEDGLPAFVDKVLPLLRERGRFGAADDEPTLRERLGGPAQYGLRPRQFGN
ncbi:NtaA/DmoA family FMN-dependent monooxygenase [Streptomyces sp. NPDC006627]|uniref:NtaA/DmoA family FMN-dependent monooxygenase n=1 Tax=Streptomyces sp. NPDC006627 TaxID=3154679 RepID=UPI0033A4FFAC